MGCASNAAEVEEDIGDVCHRDKCEDTALLLFDLNHMLGWRDYRSTYFKDNACRSDRSLPFGEHRVFPRPHVDQLVASMLQHSGCEFHIASGLGRWHCVPFVRILLKHAIPGDWVVDEVIEGRWTRDATDVRIIEKT